MKVCYEALITKTNQLYQTPGTDLESVVMNVPEAQVCEASVAFLVSPKDVSFSWESKKKKKVTDIFKS